MRRRVLDVLRAASPTAYRFVRHAAALVEWSLARRRSSDPYDDEFWDFHDVGDWDGFAALVRAYLPAASVVDIGCGQALLLHALGRADPSLTLRGYEASPSACRRARSRGVDVRPFDLVSAAAEEYAHVRADVASCDLAICLEVAEHVPPWYGTRLVDLLASAPRLLFSAAAPGQGGVLHVNERPASYWIARFQRRGLSLAADDEAFRARLASLALPPWYGANVHVFERAGPR
ncbi:MAG TPA: methyltransferase [Vicinamibacterales bacterium]|nr:methyltransferase [Vicinamibacterales bacterium]